MSYRPSGSAQKLSKKYQKRGKENSLILPHYQPPGERVAAVFTWLLLFASVGLAFYHWLYAIAGGLLALIVFSIRELFLQDDHALIRIYGPFGRLRYLFEKQFRDKYLQYFNETNTDGRPIPRVVRDYIYQKAHKVPSYGSFGTELDIKDPEMTTGVRILHKNFPGKSAAPSYEVMVGEKREGVRPFKVKCATNVSAMSYGALNYRACEALSFGVKDIAFVNCGEGGYGPHGVSGCDVVFQIGTGKFGVGDFADLPDGSQTRVLNDQLLAQLTKDHQNIGMIQIKISQGAKPGMGGFLPAEKVTPEIADVRKVKPFTAVKSPPYHTEVLGNTPAETMTNLMNFIERIRKLTSLPVDLKICFGNMREVDMLVEAMKVTGKGPDAIHVDGADGGTGAGPNLYLNYVGYGSAIETLDYLDERLKQAKIRDQVVLTASGRIFTPAHAAYAFACGADVVGTARGAMLALGCIQSLHCHSNKCPTGIATNNAWRMHGLDIPEKSTRVHNFLLGFQKDMLELTRVMGHADPRDITKDDLRVLEPSPLVS